MIPSQEPIINLAQNYGSIKITQGCPAAAPFPAQTGLQTRCKSKNRIPVGAHPKTSSSHLLIASRNTSKIIKPIR